LQQLEGVQFHGENEEARSNELRRLPVPTLITVDDDDLNNGIYLRPPGPHHLRFWLSRIYEVDQSHLEGLMDLVGVASPPQSLHLPISLRDKSGSDVTEVTTALFTLLATCATHHVEVLWYDPDEEDNYAVSPSFWRYAKRLKRRSQH
jgi:hypothetical protein